MSKIRNKLYLGDWNDAQNLQGLKRKNISHILQAAFELRQVFPQMFTYKTINADDLPSYDLSPYFEEAADWIHQSLQVGTGVLVHCHMGISRSTTLLLAYLMKYEGLSLTEALSQVRTLRPIVNPNSGFMQQLRKYELKLSQKRPQYMNSQYGGFNSNFFYASF